jgi:hypothetical protein
MSRRKIATGSAVLALVVVGAGLAGWAARWPPTMFGSPRSAPPLGPRIQVSQIGGRPATPYQVGAGEYVDNVGAWKSLPTASRAELVRQLHVAERRFEALGRAVFPSRVSFTLRATASGSTASHAEGSILLAARSGSVAGGLPQDFGATAFGDHPFDYGTATYEGVSGLWGTVPCATGTSELPGKPEVTICGGQVEAIVQNLPQAGMTAMTVIVNGYGAAMAAQPVIATYTNISGHAQAVTVTGTSASVTASLRSSPISAACSPARILYAAPSPARPSIQMTDNSAIDISSCLSSFDALVPVGKALKVISGLRTWASFAGDAYDTVTNAQQLRSSAALQACTTGRMLSYIGGALAPAGLPVPSCSPVTLPTWTGTIPAGQAIQFAATPVIEEGFTGPGQGEATLFTFTHLHIGLKAPAAPPCTSAALASALRATDAHLHLQLVLPENWAVQDYACQSGYALAGLSGNGYPSDAIYKQQGPSWIFACVLGEFNSCSTVQNGHIVRVSSGLEPSPALLQSLINQANGAKAP